MGMANKIRVLLIERNMKIKDLAEQFVVDWLFKFKNEIYKLFIGGQNG